jgi:hypothetical protein
VDCQLSDPTIRTNSTCKSEKRNTYQHEQSAVEAVLSLAGSSELGTCKLMWRLLRHNVEQIVDLFDCVWLRRDV